MKFYNSKTVLILYLALTFAACSALQNAKGEGPVVTKTFQLDKLFHKVLVTSGWEVELLHGRRNRLVVETEENLMPLLQYDINNSQLRISTSETIGESKSRKITVYYRGELSAIKASGGSTVYSGQTFDQKGLNLSSNTHAKLNIHLRTQHCQAKSDTGGTMELHGTSKDFDVEAGTQAEINAYELQTETCYAKAAMGAKIKINVLESLVKELKLGGEITYSGDPKKVRVKRDYSNRRTRKSEKDQTDSKENTRKTESEKNQRQ